MARVLALVAALVVGAPSVHAHPLTVPDLGVPDSVDAAMGLVYELDANHSLLDFTARHLGFGRVRGTFNDYRAAALITPDDLTRSTFRVVAQIASLDTQNPGRDQLLRDEFFAAAEHPTLTFTSRSIAQRGATYVMTGDLQIRDVTREVAIPFDVITLDGRDQWENSRIALEGGLTINRNDFDVVYDNDFWNGIVSDSIRIDISFGAARYNALNEIFPWRPNSIATVIRDGIERDGLDATLARVRRLHAEDPDAWSFGFGPFYRAGWALYQQERFEAARDVFTLALDLLAEDAEPTEQADLHLALAEIELARGDRGAALSHVGDALRVDAQHPAAFLLDQQIR